jgi:hypothetical protein
MTMTMSDTTANAKVVGRAWSDPAFKAQLLADPNATLAAMGAPVPPGVAVKVVENTDQLVHLVLPPRPADTELPFETLQKVAAGLPTPFGPSTPAGSLVVGMVSFFFT